MWPMAAARQPLVLRVIARQPQVAVAISPRSAVGELRWAEKGTMFPYLRVFSFRFQQAEAEQPGVPDSALEVTHCRCGRPVPDRSDASALRPIA